MDKRALSLEIDLLLKKINARHQKMMGYGADIPEGFAELLQQEVLTLYKKYVQLEFTLHAEQLDILPYPEQQVQPVPQPEPKPAVAVPEPQPQPEIKPEPQTEIKPEAKTAETPQQEDIKTTPAISEADADSIVRLVQQALSAQGEPRVNPFATPQPAQVPQPKVQPEEKPAQAQSPQVQSQPEVPQQQQVQPPVKPVSTPAPALKQDEEAPLTLADKLRMQGITDLRKAIPIADKFLYMNELFQGEINHYNQALDRFNNCSNALEARDLFESMKQHFEWDENSKTVKRFADLLTRKFL